MSDGSEIAYRRSGEHSIVLEVGGELLSIIGGRMNGVGSLFLELASPPGAGPPPHTDPSEEIIYVLEGEFDVICPAGAETVTHHASAGDSVVISKRAPHTYRDAGSSNGRLLVFFRDTSTCSHSPSNSAIR